MKRSALLWAVVLAPLLATNPATALLKGPMDPDGPPLADWAAAVVAEHLEVPIPQMPAVETAASTPLPNDGESDTAATPRPLQRPGRTPPPPRLRRPPLGRLPLLWTLLLLPPFPLLLQLSATPSSTASLPLGQGGPASTASSGTSVLQRAAAQAARGACLAAKVAPPRQ
jgi:hypothetical protein